MSFRRLGVIFVLLLINLSLSESESPKEDKEVEAVVGGYLPEYRSYINVNESATLLSDLILFSIEPKVDGSVKGSCCLGSDHFDLVRKARSHAPNLRLWVTVGGGGRSQHFRRIVSDEHLRRQLLVQLRELCETEDLDGVDFDWEVPMSKDDLKGYYRLLREAAKVFQGEEGKKLLISVALHANMFLPIKLYKYLDRVNLMAYDLPSETPSRNYHADAETVKVVAKSFLDRGCPSRKLVVGIPVYARHRNNPGVVKTISEIVDMAGTHQVLQQSSNYEGFEFETRKDIQAKVDFVIKHGLGGIFFWEVGQDKQDPQHGPGGVLMQSVAETLFGRNTKDRQEL